MRGLTHFIVGAMVITLFASAMHGVVEQTSLIILVAAFFGLLPDTLDFKFNQYIETHHVTIDPHPDNPNPQEIADKLADAINKAGRIEPGKMMKVRLHSMRIGPDLWKEYAVFFDTRKKEVKVRLGPECTTGRAMVPETEPPEEEAVKTAPFEPKLIDPYGRPSQIASFSGPSFGFQKRKDGSVEVIFLPWHRRSGHSLTMGAFFAAIVYLLASLAGSTIPHIWAAAVFLPWAMHIILDQYGHMGNNLFWPFTKGRNQGLGLVSAADPFWNFFAIFSSIAIMFWNMNRFAPSAERMMFGPEVPIWFYLLFVIVIPFGILGALIIIHRSLTKKERETPPSVKSAMTRILEDLPEDQRLEVEERPVPPLTVRILGLVVLAAVLVGLYIFGGSL